MPFKDYALQQGQRVRRQPERCSRLRIFVNKRLVFQNISFIAHQQRIYGHGVLNVKPV